MEPQPRFFCSTTEVKFFESKFMGACFFKQKTKKRMETWMSSWVSCIKKVEWGDFCLRNGIKWDNDSSEITLHCCQNMFCLMLKVGVDIKNVQRKILMFVKPKPINLARSPLPMPYCNVCKKNHLSNAFSVGWLFDSTCIWQKKTWNFPRLFGGSLHGI